LPLSHLPRPGTPFYGYTCSKFSLSLEWGRFAVVLCVFWYILVAIPSYCHLGFVASFFVCFGGGCSSERAFYFSWSCSRPIKWVSPLGEEVSPTQPSTSAPFVRRLLRSRRGCFPRPAFPFFPLPRLCPLAPFQLQPVAISPPAFFSFFGVGSPGTGASDPP